MTEQLNWTELYKEELKHIPLNGNTCSYLQKYQDNTQLGIMKNKARLEGTYKMGTFKIYIYIFLFFLF